MFTFAACQQVNDPELVSTPENSKISVVSETSNQVLTETTNTDGTISMTNGDIVGPLYKEHYYDILTQSYFVFTTDTEGTRSTFVSYGEYFKMEFTNISDADDYILLHNESGKYWINKDKKTITKLESHDVSTIRNVISSQVFTGVQYIKTYDRELDGKKYTVEEYKYKDSDGHICFYFQNNVLKIIKDDQNSMDILEISSNASLDMLDTPKGYTEISVEKAISQESQSSVSESDKDAQTSKTAQ